MTITGERTRSARRPPAQPPVTSIRLPEALQERLADYARDRGITRAVAIRRLISQGLDRG